MDMLSPALVIDSMHNTGRFDHVQADTLPRFVHKGCNVSLGPSPAPDSCSFRSRRTKISIQKSKFIHITYLTLGKNLSVLPVL